MKCKIKNEKFNEFTEKFSKVFYAKNYKEKLHKFMVDNELQDKPFATHASGKNVTFAELIENYGSEEKDFSDLREMLIDNITENTLKYVAMNHLEEFSISAMTSFNLSLGEDCEKCDGLRFCMMMDGILKAVRNEKSRSDFMELIADTIQFEKNEEPEPASHICNDCGKCESKKISEKIN